MYKFSLNNSNKSQLLRSTELIDEIVDIDALDFEELENYEKFKFEINNSTIGVIVLNQNDEN